MLSGFGGCVADTASECREDSILTSILGPQAPLGARVLAQGGSGEEAVGTGGIWRLINICE